MIEASLLVNLKVLYVEDDEDTRFMTQMFLKKRVGKLITAVDGEDALAKFEANQPDMIITDLRMPKMDGLELSRKIRQRNKRCAIIITTAFSEIDVVIEAVDIGVEKYVVKPIDTNELLEAMSACALKYYEFNGDDLLLGNMRMDNLEEKKDLEQKIQNKMALFIKTNSGKGPRFVKAFIKGDCIEIEAKDALTLYEKALLENRKNEHLVGYAREAFYKDRKNLICTIVFELTKSRCHVEHIEIDLNNSVDRINIRLDT